MWWSSEPTLLPADSPIREPGMGRYRYPFACGQQLAGWGWKRRSRGQQNSGNLVTVQLLDLNPLRTQLLADCSG